VLLFRDGSGQQTAARRTLSIALARCRACKGRFRVLPADVLPHKRYGLAVIVSLTSAHVEANKPLRHVAWTTHLGQTPVHSTLHAWTEGLGAFVLGRAFGSMPRAYPFQAIMAATTARWSTLASVEFEDSPIDPLRYRTPARCERLGAAGKLLTIARAVIAVALPELLGGQTPLCEWRKLTTDLGLPAPFGFRAGLTFHGEITCTPFERRIDRDRESPQLVQQTGDFLCETRTRSPPSASSRSLPSSILPSTPQSDGV
jgi:hypothetical protein